MLIGRFHISIIGAIMQKRTETAHDELGNKPRSLRETIADTVQWLKENHPMLSIATG
jgi:hypothetical protein